MRDNRIDNKIQKKKPIEYTYTFKINKSAFLLEFLLSKLSMSRNSIKSLLSENKVLVNGSVVRQFDYPLAKDDEIKIAKHSQNTSNPAKKKSKNVCAFPLKDYIIFEDNNYIAINKPSGILSVESDTENDSIYKYVFEYLTINDPKKRPYLLHRIDKDTSGVIVFCKDIKLHSMLKMHWNEDVKVREYYAICEGLFEKKTGTIKSYLKENQNNLMYSTLDKKGKLAITHYEVVKSNNEFSLVKVLIDSGRKNQIRVHMKDIGHMVVGDEKYRSSQNPINRLGLHASRLDFINPIDKKIISFAAKVPKEFLNLFK